MLIHHLVGKNVNENIENLNRCIEQSKSFIKNGRLIIVESCVPNGFIILKSFFKPTSYLINKFMKHLSISVYGKLYQIAY